VLLLQARYEHNREPEEVEQTFRLCQTPLIKGTLSLQAFGSSSPEDQVESEDKTQRCHGNRYRTHNDDCDHSAGGAQNIDCNYGED
jgi:hypothetical protein